MKAGFDLSQISVENWKALLDKFNMCHEAEKCEEKNGWHWWQHGTSNTVVTANNPLTGFYWYDRLGNDESVKGFTGYVGIEGDSAFVAEFFCDFKELAEFIKDEGFGRREYI